MGKRVRLTKKTRPGLFSHSNPDSGHPTPRRWKKCAALPSKERGEVGVPRNLFPRLGLGDCLLWGRLEPAFGGIRRRGSPDGQSSRRS